MKTYLFVALLGAVPFVGCHSTKMEPMDSLPIDTAKTPVSANFLPQGTALGAPELVQGNNAFALDLYQTIFKASKNQFFSPYSISSALAMTYGGASGETEKQMSKVLHFSANTQAFHQAFGELQKTINGVSKEGQVELRIANRLWGSLTYKFKAEFLELCKGIYNAPLDRIDMKNAEAAAKTVNEWVERQTNQKIKDLLKKEHIQPLTHLILVNAIYFLGNWSTSFDEQMTQDRQFTPSSGKAIMTKTMYAYQKPNDRPQIPYQYTETEQGQWLELPYSGGTTSMVVFLPKQGKTLDESLKKMSHKDLENAMNALKRPAVGMHIYLPRWKATDDMEMRDIFEKMGMAAAFSDGAEFPYMSEPGQIPLKIGNVIHKAFIEVTEKGTEAAAATAVIMVETTSAVQHREPVREIYFDANRPYLYLIREKTTGSILFMGHVDDPS